jgi:hypothetical protein
MKRKKKIVYYVGSCDPDWGVPGIFTTRRGANRYLENYWCRNVRGHCPSPKNCMWVIAGYIEKVHYTEGQLLNVLKQRYLTYSDMPEWVKKG